LAIRTWQTIKVRYCDQAGREVSLEAQAIYPEEWMPDQAPRLGAHRCSQSRDCLLFQKPRCVWAGNPGYDPFEEKSDEPKDE
jgi:hypothetical protein